MYINEGRERCVTLANYMLENSTTVRQTAAHFGISKSTVHKDVTVTLEKVNRPLHDRICDLLEINKRERHIRGGEATKKKYAALRHFSAPSIRRLKSASPSERRSSLK